MQKYFSELECEYKRQIEYYKEEEHKAKKALRQQELDFIRQRQELEQELEKQQSIVRIYTLPPM